MPEHIDHKTNLRMINFDYGRGARSWSQDPDFGARSRLCSKQIGARTRKQFRIDPPDFLNNFRFWYFWRFIISSFWVLFAMVNFHFTIGFWFRSRISCFLYLSVSFLVFYCSCFVLFHHFFSNSLWLFFFNSLHLNRYFSSFFSNSSTFLLLHPKKKYHMGFRLNWNLWFLSASFPSTENSELLQFPERITIKNSQI